MAKALLGEPIPRGTLPALVDETNIVPGPSDEQSDRRHAWSELVSTSWNLAFLPVLTWSSVMAASWNAWTDCMRAGTEG